MSRFHLVTDATGLRLDDADGFSFEYRRKDSPKVLLLAALWLALGWTAAVALETDARIADGRDSVRVADRQARVLEQQERTGREQQALIERAYTWLGLIHAGESSYPATLERARARARAREESAE